MGENLKTNILGEGAAGEEPKTGWEGLSDAENPAFNPDEKAEEYKYSPEEYEKLSNTERLLRHAVDETITFKVNGIRGGISDIYEGARKDMRFSNRQTLESLEEISAREKGTSVMETEALVGLIDALYPSQFGNQPSASSDPEAQEEEYYTSARRKGSILGDEIDSLARALGHNEALENTDIARSTAQLAGSMEGNTIVARAMIDYLHEPTDDSRSRLQHVIGQFVDESTDGVRRLGLNISETSDQLGDSVVMLGRKMERGNEEYYDAVMKYIGFKLKYAPADNAERVKAELEKRKENRQRLASEFI